jgi:hypothetical protein
MTRRRASVVAKALVDKGMVSSRSHHHIMFHKDIDGVTQVVTRISHGASEIGDTIGKLMANQCFLRLREFWQLVDCSLTESAWDETVRTRSVGGRNPFLGAGS